ncbi:hypothetical protein A2U01_0058980, partial [Trifolium medium]|nr:hypothetical protein [Trifolium medium]
FMVDEDEEVDIVKKSLASSSSSSSSEVKVKNSGMQLIVDNNGLGWMDLGLDKEGRRNHISGTEFDDADGQLPDGVTLYPIFDC